MAATVELCQDTGTATGSPAKGTTRTIPVEAGHWRGSDVPSIVANPFINAPIAQGANSYDVYLFARFSGTWNAVANALWSHTSGSVAAGCTINALVSSIYNTPSQSENAALTVDMTSVVAILSGEAVLFGATGPEDVSPVASIASTTANPAYTQYLISQLLTTGATPAGSIGATEWTIQYDEQ